MSCLNSVVMETEVFLIPHLASFFCVYPPSTWVLFSCMFFIISFFCSHLRVQKQPMSLVQTESLWKAAVMLQTGAVTDVAIMADAVDRLVM